MKLCGKCFCFRYSSSLCISCYRPDSILFHFLNLRILYMVNFHGTSTQHCALACMLVLVYGGEFERGNGDYCCLKSISSLQVLKCYFPPIYQPFLHLLARHFYKDHMLNSQLFLLKLCLPVLKRVGSLHSKITYREGRWLLKGKKEGVLRIY